MRARAASCMTGACRPYPIVNVIEDMPSRTGESLKALASARNADRAQDMAEAAAEDSEATREKHDLELDNQILDRVASIKSLSSHLRGF